nr:hypothetical protein Q903MT_gene3597 [Picea sitchensis]
MELILPHELITTYAYIPFLRLQTMTNTTMILTILLLLPYETKRKRNKSYIFHLASQEEVIHLASSLDVQEVELSK